jgi:hypothetical protein
MERLGQNSGQVSASQLIENQNINRVNMTVNGSSFNLLEAAGMDFGHRWEFNGPYGWRDEPIRVSSTSGLSLLMSLVHH